MSKLNENVLSAYFQAFADTALDSPNSYRQYLSTVNEWESFVGSQNVLTFTIGEVFSFVSKLRSTKGFKSRYDSDDDKLTFGTIRRKITILKTYYRYLQSLEVVEKNPFENPQFAFKKKHDAPKRPAELADFDKIQKLLDVIPAGSKVGIRDRALMAVLFGCGLRRGEANNLRMSHIIHHPVNGPQICIFKGKTSARTLSVGPWAHNYLNALLVQRVVEGASALDHVFVHYRTSLEIATCKPVSVDTIYDKIKLYCGPAGLPNTISPHSGRATFVTKALAGGASYDEIQMDTGHKSVKTVEGYKRKYLQVGAAKKISFE